MSLSAKTPHFEDLPADLRALSHALTDDVPICICAFAPDGTLLFVSDEAAALVKAEPGALLGRCMFDFLSASERDRLQTGLARLTPEQPLYSHEQIHSAPNGEHRILKWSNRAIFDEAGRLLHYQSVGIDIAAHRRVKETAILQLFAERVRAEHQRRDTAQRIQRQLVFQRAATEMTTASVAATSDTEFKQAVTRCLQQVGALLKVDVAYVLRFSDSLSSFTMMYDWCASEAAKRVGAPRDFNTDDFPWWMARLLESGLVHIPDVARLPPEAGNEQALFTHKTIRSLVDAGIRGPAGVLRGVVGFCRLAETGPWSEEELDMLKALASFIGVVLERRLTDEALAQSKLMLETAIAQSPSGILIADAPDVSIRLANMAAIGIRGYENSAKLTGIAVSEHAGRWQTYLPDGKPYPSESLPLSRAVIKGETVKDEELIIRNDDGDNRWIIANAAPIRNPAGEVTSGIVVFHDITERKRGEDKLKQAASVFQHANEGITITDVEGRFVDVNVAFSRITGYSRDEVLGKHTRLLSSGLHDPLFYREMWQALSEQGSWTGEIWNKRKNGDVYPERLTISAVRDETGRVEGYVGLFSDISEEKAYQAQLENLARYDALTGLPNRVLLADRMQQAIAQAHRRGKFMSVAYIDLDGFKEINDGHGHDIGDCLLVVLADRMKSVLREGDTLSRLGGDEFVAVLVDLEGVDDCMPLLDRLVQAVAHAVPIGGVLLKVSASVGVTFYPQPDHVDPDQLVRQADQAMYQAKLAGKNCFRLFDAHHERHVRSRHEGLQRMRQALEQQEFVLHYQPKVRMRDCSLIGTEALIRWNHPERGLLSPAAFLPLIEGHTLMIDIGDWVIESALSQIVTWREQGLPIPVSVNVDAVQLRQRDFIDKLRAALARHPQVCPGDLELEIVETSALADFEHVSGLLAACRALGVGFALDDFGTGYSSLTYLKNLAVDNLKIDQSFVRDILENADNLAILEGIVGLADALQRDVIAEGVEREEHGQILLQLGCEIGQGYAIARPMPADEIATWRAEGSIVDSWQNCTPLSRDARPVLFARIAHLAWMMNLRRHVRGEVAAPPELGVHDCQFGRWVDRLGSQDSDQGARLVSINKWHDVVHETAHQLVRSLGSGESWEHVASRLDRVERASTKLLEALDDFELKRESWSHSF